jgi:hypothetical protein
VSLCDKPVALFLDVDGTLLDFAPRAPERSASMACRFRRIRRRSMIAGRRTCTQNLDLALIGQWLRRRAGRQQRPHRVVLFSHFDSDPAFSRLLRLLAGDDEKGFPTLRSPRRNRAISRNTAIVETTCRCGRRQAAGHGFRAALRAIRVGVPAAANHPDRIAGWPATHHRLRTPLRGHSSGHRRALGQSAAFLLSGPHHKMATRLSSSWEDAWADVSS